MDLDELRASVPALDERVYLNTGAAGPSSSRVVDAVKDALEYHEFESPGADGMYPAAFGVYDTARSTVADLLGADPSEVALTESTTDGLNRIATAIDWQPGDVVVRTDVEHAAGTLPWQRLERERGIEVRVLETDAGTVDFDAAEAALAGADLFVCSSITWTHGARHPVSDLVDVAHDAGARVLLDAVQSVGQTPVDVREWDADFVAAAGHKWLLGPFGSGFLYVRDGAERDLVPGSIGYRSVEKPDDLANGYRLESGARRFETGTSSPLPYAGLVAAIDLLDAVGYERIEGRIERLTDRLKAGVAPDRLLSPRPFESGLVTIAVDDPEETVTRLSERGIVVRSIPGLGAIRASVHAFNTNADVDALLEALG